MLDTGVLGYLCHPHKHADVRAWAETHLTRHPATHALAVPEIADYELRRVLLFRGATTGLWHLNHLAKRAVYVRLDTETMQLAASLWARLRKGGMAVDDPKALGADVILAAQAQLHDATVVTTNVKHLGRMVKAVAWQDVV